MRRDPFGGVPGFTLREPWVHGTVPAHQRAYFVTASGKIVTGPGGGRMDTAVQPTFRSVADGTELTTLLASGTLVGGDVIELAKDGEFQGPFTLPVVSTASATAYVTIQTAGYGAGVGDWPAADTKVTPTDHASLMATVLASDVSTDPSFIVAPGAHHWKLRGLHCLGVDQGSFGAANSSLIWIRYSTDAGVGGSRPHHIAIEHCLIRGASSYLAVNGVRVWGDTVTVKNCWIDRIGTVGSEGQCIELSAGSGHVIQNCLLSGSTENIMVGGNALPDESYQATDITIRYCRFEKPGYMYMQGPDWDGVNAWNTKNLFEVKGGQRILLEGCDFGEYYKGAQSYAMQFTRREIEVSDGMGGYLDTQNPWQTVKDVTLRYCRFAGMPKWISTLSYADDHNAENAPEHMNDRVTVEQCLVTDVDAGTYDVSGGEHQGDSVGLMILIQQSGFTFDHVTFWTKLEPYYGAGHGLGVSLDVASPAIPYARLVITNSIMAAGACRGDYGGTTPFTHVFCSDALDGTPDATVTGNVLAGATGSDPASGTNFPGTGNAFPTRATMEASHFTDPATGDFRLKSDSTYKVANGFATTDDDDPGVDQDALEAALANIK